MQAKKGYYIDPNKNEELKPMIAPFLPIAPLK